MTARDATRRNERIYAGHVGTPTALSLLTTCLNEADNIDALVVRSLNAFDELGVPAELVIVDDGSTDETWARISDWASRDPRVRGLRHAQNEGIETAWRSLVAAATGSLVCLIDADLQNRPEDVKKLLIAYHASGADIVQGSRCPVRSPRMRLWLSRGLNTLLNLSFGMKLKDNKSGFILCRKETLRATLQHRKHYRFFQCFLAISAHAKGFEIHEVDTVFEPRLGGQSFLNNMPLKVMGLILLEIIKARGEFCDRGNNARRHVRPRVAVTSGRCVKGTA